MLCLDRAALLKNAIANPDSLANPDARANPAQTDLAHVLSAAPEQALALALALDLSADQVAGITAFALCPASINRHGTVWSPYEDAWILWLRQRKLTATQMVPIVGRQRPTIYNRLRILNAQIFSRRTWSAEETARLMQLVVEQHKSVADVAAQFDRTPDQVRSHLKDHGVSMKALHEAEKQQKQAEEALRRAADPQKQANWLRQQTRRAQRQRQAWSATEINTLRDAASIDAACRALPHRSRQKILEKGYAIGKLFELAGCTWDTAKLSQLERLIQVARGNSQRMLNADDFEEIAAALGSTARMVKQRAREHGFIAMMRPRRSLDATGQAKALTLLGLTITTAAKQLRCDTRTLKAYADSQGVSFAKASRRQPQMANADKAELSQIRQAAAAQRKAEAAERKAAKAEAAKAQKAEAAKQAEAKKLAAKVAKAAKMGKAAKVAKAVLARVPKAVKIKAQKPKISTPAKALPEVRPKPAKAQQKASLDQASVRQASQTEPSRAAAVAISAGQLYAAAKAMRSEVEANVPAAGQQRQDACPIVDNSHTGHGYLMPVKVTFKPRHELFEGEKLDQNPAAVKARRKAAFTRIAKKAPAGHHKINAADTAALIAAHLATQGVTRIGYDKIDLLIRAIERRGYQVMKQGAGFLIDGHIVIASQKDLESFAERRQIAA